MDKTDIFLLTKPPQSDRTKLCFQLIEQSDNPALYLAADGVYNLLETDSMKALPIKRILASKEDLDARSVQAREQVIVADNFYELLVEEMMSEGSRVYAF
jgi:tRNA 2-thiouridine synthesizing protein B